jgi:hypothetical protein
LREKYTRLKTLSAENLTAGIHVYNFNFEKFQINNYRSTGKYTEYLPEVLNIEFRKYTW